MDFRVLAVCILSYFEAIRCDTEGKPIENVPSNKSEIGGPKVQDLPPNKDVKLEFDHCLKRFRETFDYKTFSSSKKLQDRFRCKLIEDISSYICKNDLKFDPETYNQEVTSLCKQVVHKNRTDLPVDVELFLDLWNKNGMMANCENVCSVNDGRYHKICYFLFNYYTDRNSSSKTKVDTSAKTVPKSNTNEDENKGAKVAILANEENRDPSNAGNEPDDRNDEDPAQDAPGNAEQEELMLENQDVDPAPKSDQKEKSSKPDTVKNERTSQSEKNRENFQNKESIIMHTHESDESEGDSHVFSYFLLISGACIVFYLMMYNKKKILALVIEGRRRNVKRRPNSAAYTKLDCNLEEAMASGPSTSTSNTLLY